MGVWTDDQQLTQTNRRMLTCRGWRPSRSGLDRIALFLNRRQRHGDARESWTDHLQVWTRCKNGKRERLLVSEPYGNQDLTLTSEQKAELAAFCREHGCEAVVGKHAMHNPHGCVSIWITYGGID